ncbi:MAG TPA: GNAT family N-acetyltransferase [Candidatus Acidoferrum sp.]|nr:GNAT family N-acetyltransferase [Candidatus Acidoferrum sp.]
MRVRLLEERDFESFRTLFDEAFSEYLEFLRQENHEQFLREVAEREEVTREGFDFYLRTGTTFVAEEEAKVVGYVASQTVPSLHGINKELWVAFIVVQKKFRRKKIGLALLAKLLSCAREAGVERVYSTINPNNPESLGLHRKAGFDVRDWKLASYEVKTS